MSSPPPQLLVDFLPQPDDRQIKAIPESSKHSNLGKLLIMSASPEDYTKTSI
jgi:hypothetical protein